MLYRECTSACPSTDTFIWPCNSGKQRKTGFDDLWTNHSLNSKSQESKAANRNFMNCERGKVSSHQSALYTIIHERILLPCIILNKAYLLLVIKMSPQCSYLYHALCKPCVPHDVYMHRVIKTRVMNLDAAWVKFHIFKFPMFLCGNKIFSSRL